MSLNACGLPSVRPRFAVRAAEVCRRIERLGVDVVNLQEVHTRRRLALLRSGLPSLPHVAYAPGALGPRGGVVTFSRYPLRPSTFVSFAPTRRHSGNRLSPFWIDLRAGTKGVLVSALRDRPLTIANAHLSPNKDGDWSPGNRFHPIQSAQLDLVRDACAGPGDTILTGDFNLAAGSALHGEFLAGGGWLDAFAGDGRPTFHVEFLPPGRPSSRIDHVLLRGDRATVHEARQVFEDRVPLAGGEAFLSDHVGLYVDASFG